MTDRSADAEATLRAALSAHARRLVPDDASAPAPRFRDRPERRRAWGARRLPPVAAAACVVGVVAAVAFIGSASPGRPAASNGAPTLRASSPIAATVHVRLLNDDDAQYGVGMPIIAYFSRAITDARPLQRATTVTVDGVPAQGGWYFQKSAAGKGPLEAHFRLPSYWPAHATVHVSLPIKGVSAGGDLAYDDSLSTTFRTGAANIATVVAAQHRLTLRHDDTPIGPFKVSLGTATRPGTKVVMEKPDTLTMRIDGELRRVHEAQRLTYGGEFLVAAPWNAKQIARGVDASNGSTDLLPTDAQRLFALTQVGDVVIFKGAAGVPMAIGSGYGDWNVSWSRWLTGGAVPTR